MFRFICAAIVLLAASPLAAQEGPGALTCLLVPERVSDIGSEVSGIVASVLVRRAEPVAAGQILMQLDDRLAQADLERARVMLEAVQARLNRAETLSQSQVISQEQIQSLRAEAAVAKAEADKAALQVDRMAIRAPFAGIVADLQIDEGELTGREPLLRLISTAKLRAEMAFPAEIFGHFAVGDRMTLAITPQGRDAGAVVVTTDPFIDPTSNSFLVVAEIDNAEGAFAAGSACAPK